MMSMVSADDNIPSDELVHRPKTKDSIPRINEMRKILLSHTELDHVGADIVQAGADLLLDKLSGNHENVLHPKGVLGCEACGSREGIATMGS